MSIESNLHLTGKTNCSYSTRVASKSLVEIGAYLCTDALFYLGEPPSLFLYYKCYSKQGVAVVYGLKSFV